jgi:hypothetical protein
MANVAASKPDNDFTFIVDGNRHDCSWFVAAFLSPRIGRLHRTDGSLNEFVVVTGDPHGYFDDFVSVGRGAPLSLTPANREFLLAIAAELENFELYWLIREEFERDKLDYLKICEFDAIDAAPERVITSIASHLSEFERPFLSRLPHSTLEAVLSHDSLRVESEDWLCDFVISVICDCGCSVSLLERIRFEYLSCSGIERFILWSFDQFDESFVTFALWRALSVRLLLSVSPSSSDSRVPNPRFSPSADGSLEGIICHLTREHGGYVHDRGIVNISASSTASDSHPVKNAADLQSTTFFHSLKLADQWVCYDFKTRRVKPTHYSIWPSSSDCRLRSWVIEGSGDGKSWVVLDNQKDNSTMNWSHPIGTFSVRESAEWRLIRLRQTGENAAGNDFLVVYGFEIFGQMIETDRSPSE